MGIDGHPVRVRVRSPEGGVLLVTWVRDGKIPASDLQTHRTRVGFFSLQVPSARLPLPTCLTMTCFAA